MAGTEHIPKSPLGGVSAFQCGNCGGQVELRAPGQTMRAACTHCGSVIDLTNPDFRVIKAYKKRLKYKPIIEIGTRGTIEEIEWEVIGFMVRKVVDYPYQWEEYLLFNPYHGFRWLLNQYGHWSFTTPLVDNPAGSSHAARHDGNIYNAYSSGKAKVMFVFGEFYWEVKRGETVETRDLVKAPEMLSLEFDDKGKSWTKSVYFPKEEIQAIFGPGLKLPPQKGIAPHQPNPFAARLKSVLPFFIAAILLVLVSQFTIFSGSSQLVSTSIGLSDSSGTELVSEPFTLEGKTGNVDVQLNASSLLNAWMYMGGYLRNRTTNETYPFSINAEYYTGYEDGERWTEGDKKVSQVINLVPGGEYELVAELSHDPHFYEYEITVRRDVPIMTNFYIVLILITLPILYLVLMSNDFKKKQWADSDYA